MIITLVAALALLLITAPLGAEAQQAGKAPRIGYLSSGAEAALRAAKHATSTIPNVMARGVVVGHNATHGWSAFDGASFQAGQHADTEISLWTWAVGYRRRLWVTTLQEKPLALEAGTGVRGIGSSTKIRTATASDSEDVFAAVIPYLELTRSSR